jgi:phosphonate transport system substrate-binding protein
MEKNNVISKKLAGVVLAGVVGALAVAPIAAQDVDRTGWPETFIIGVYPGDNVEEALAAVEPLRVYLEEQLGVRTVLITGTSYGTVIEAVRAGRADALEVGPRSYVLASDVSEAIAVANYEVEVDLNEVPGYFSLMFTQQGSGITSIADLEGATFAFTDPASTSGYLVPAADAMTANEFTEATQLETFFGELVFAGNHPAAVLAVANGSVQAAATFDANLPAQVDQGAILPEQLCGYTDMGIDGPATAAEWPFLEALTVEEIAAINAECPEGSLVVFHQSPLIPETPFAVRSDLPESFKSAVQTALLSIADNQELVNALERYYVDPTAAAGVDSIDALYDPLRVLGQLLGE